MTNTQFTFGAPCRKLAAGFKKGIKSMEERADTARGQDGVNEPPWQWLACTASWEYLVGRPEKRNHGLIQQEQLLILWHLCCLYFSATILGEVRKQYYNYQCQTSQVAQETKLGST